MPVTRIGLDVAKSSFQLHGVEAHGKVVVRKHLSRSKGLAYCAQLPACRGGREAWGSAHDWGREVQKLGHEVRLMAVRLSKPYRTKQKNDRHDAEASCAAGSRPPRRFVPRKTVEPQAVLTVQRSREVLGSERTAVANQIRGRLLEYGVAMAPGIQRWRRELPAVLSAEEAPLPTLARTVISELHGRLLEVEERSAGHERQRAPVARQNEAAKRRMRGEGVGPITATALVATVGAAPAFPHGRQVAAWVGVVPKHFRTGGKPVRGRITNRGTVSLRTLLLHGARSVLPFTAQRTDTKRIWVEAVRHRRGDHSAAVAVAATQARLLGALLAGAKSLEEPRQETADERGGHPTCVRPSPWRHGRMA